MLDAVDIRDCYVALGQLVAQQPQSEFGPAAAAFLVSASGAARSQYWELSAGADAFVLMGDVQFGDSANSSANQRVPIRGDGRSTCPFDLLALSGKPLYASRTTGHDFARIPSALGHRGQDTVHFVPFKDDVDRLFGCAVFWGLRDKDWLETTEFRIATRSIVSLGSRHRDRKRLLRSQMEMSAALRRYDDAKRQRRESLDRDLMTALPGQSPAMQQLRSRLQEISRARHPVLISTASGDTADIVARQALRLAGNETQPLVVVHAANLRGDSLAVELFGHKRGAIPGVSAARRGLLREAAQGGVLIDRIEELDMAGQEQILRLLQTRSYRPFGSSRDLPLEARIFLSLREESLTDETTKPILPALYFELRPHALTLPSLVSCIEDTLNILETELARAGFDQQEIDACLADRTLTRALKGRAHEHGRVSMAALIRSALNEASQSGEPLASTHVASVERISQSARRPQHDALPERVAAFEAEVISEALERFDGRRAEAARWLSVPKRTLADKCRRYGL